MIVISAFSGPRLQSSAVTGGKDASLRLASIDASGTHWAGGGVGSVLQAETSAAKRAIKTIVRLRIESLLVRIWEPSPWDPCTDAKVPAG